MAHRREVLEEPASSPVPCPKCGAGLASRERLRGHMVQAHGAVPRETVVRYAAFALMVVVLGAGLFVLAGNGGFGGGTAAATRTENVERFGLADDPYLGEAEAPLVIVEFATPKCPSCRFFHTSQLSGIQERWLDTGRAVLYYAQFTIGYDFDEPGGVAQECVLREGGNAAFWPFTALLYERQGDISAGDLPGVLRTFAGDHGLDGDALVACYEGRETQEAYDADLRAGRRAGVYGTPGFFVFGESGAAKRVGSHELEAALTELESG